MLDGHAGHLPVVIFKIDDKGIFTYVNEFIRGYGYSPEYLIGKPISRFITPEDLPTMQKVLDDRANGDFSLKKNQYRFHDAYNNCLDLDVRTLVISEKNDGGYEVVSDPGSKPFKDYATLGLAWDVTSRVKSEEILTAILDNNPNGMIVYNQNDTIVRANQEAYELLAYTSEMNAVGLSILDFIHPDDRKTVSDRKVKLLSGKDLGSIDIRLIKADDSFLMVEVRPGSVEIDGEKFILVSFVDIEEKRKKERLLKEREERYRAIYEHANDAILLMRGEIFIDCNQKTLEMYGCTKDDIVGHTPFEYSPEYQGKEKSDKLALEKINLALSGTSNQFQWIHKRKDGTYFNAEVSLSKINLDGDDLVLAIVRDISKRKQAEQQFKTIYENSPVAVVITDKKGIIKTINPKGCSFFDFTESELVGNHFSIVSDQDSTTPLEKKMVRSVLSGEVASGSIKKSFTNKHGDEIYGNLRLNRIMIDGEYHLMATIEDVSQLERAYKALSYRSKLETFLGEIASEFITLPLGEIDEVTQIALKEISEMTNVDLGYIIVLDDDEAHYSVSSIWTSENLKNIRKEDFQKLPVENIKRWIEELKKDKVFAVSDFQALDDKFKIEKIRMKNLGITSAIDIPMIYENELIGYVGFSNKTRREWDEDEVSLLRFASSVFTAAFMRSRIQEQKENLTRQLYQAQKMEEVGRLSGGIAHDFNNLLTVILGNIDLMKLYHERPDQSEKNSDKIKSMLEEMESSTENAANLTKQLLVFSRTSIIQSKIFDPNESVKGFQKMISRITPSNIIKTYELTSEEVSIEMDPTHMQQIILNLVINAVDAMPNGGTLALKSKVITLKQDEIQCAICNKKIEGKFIKIEIEDTGSGISNDQIQNIFEPFFTTKEAGKGTGLGLATITNILKSAGGHVQVESQLGIGTRFYVYLPLVEERVERSAQMINKTTAPLEGEGKIVVIEDNPNVLKMLVTTLQSSGFEIDSFGTGMEALEYCKRKECTPKLVITDYIMPGMNGLELIEKIKDRNPEIPVLLMSGYTGTTDIQDKVKELNIPFLGKPFSRSDLINTIKEIVKSNE